MSKKQEQCQAQREEGNELGMRGWHPVSLPMHLLRSFLFQYAFQGEIKSLACHLPAEHHEDLDFAGRPDQRCVDDAEALGNEGQPGAEVGNGIIGVLGRSAKGPE